MRSSSSGRRTSRMMKLAMFSTVFDFSEPCSNKIVYIELLKIDPTHHCSTQYKILTLVSPAPIKDLFLNRYLLNDR